MDGDTLSLDERIVLAMRVPGDPAQPIGPAWVEEAFRDFTGLGGVGVLGLLTAATLGYLWLQGRRWGALYLLLAIGGGLLVSLALKAGFHRPRHDLVSHGSMVYTASFPSGHSMLSAVVHLTGGAMLALVHRRRSVRDLHHRLRRAGDRAGRSEPGLPGRPLGDPRACGLGGRCRLGGPVLADRPGVPGPGVCGAGARAGWGAWGKSGLSGVGPASTFAGICGHEDFVVRTLFPRPLFPFWPLAPCARKNADQFNYRLRYIYGAQRQG